MPLWQILLIALVAAWALQAIGTFFQMRHYRAVMGDISQRWGDGFVGAGSARSTLGRGVILVLVVDAGRIVRRLTVMQGRSVFAKFRAVEGVEGRSLEALRRAPPFTDKGSLKALEVAIGQVDKVSRREAAAPAQAALA